MTTLGQAGYRGYRTAQNGHKSLFSGSFHSSGEALNVYQGMARFIKLGSGFSSSQIIDQTPSSFVTLLVPLRYVNISLQAGGASVWFEPERGQESNTQWLDSGLT